MVCFRLSSRTCMARHRTASVRQMTSSILNSYSKLQHHFLIVDAELPSAEHAQHGILHTIGQSMHSPFSNSGTAKQPQFPDSNLSLSCQPDSAGQSMHSTPPGTTSSHNLLKHVPASPSRAKHAQRTFKNLADQSGYNLLRHDTQLPVPQGILQHVHDAVIHASCRCDGRGWRLGRCFLLLSTLRGCVHLCETAQ